MGEVIRKRFVTFSKRRQPIALVKGGAARLVNDYFAVDLSGIESKDFANGLVGKRR